ncbi:MAG: glycogen debranching enzyme, partial [Gammaproteobacteria bacterium]|nr:glycogen debranching enzyme [Gammaproteobacteria bacterium]
MIENGHPDILGATVDDSGTNFALYSSVAERVELCLFDVTGKQRRIDLPAHSRDVWHGYLPGCRPGQHYGYRVHGEYDAEHGRRCNPAKLLLDPYARALAGDFEWADAVYD